MSKEFIKKKYNSNALDEAVRQQRQLSYFTTSCVQEDIRSDYFEKWAERKFYTNDVFLNWVKQILKTKNFTTFAKYFRNPNPSSKLINTRIKEPLSRVFFSEDSYFNYKINGKDVEHPLELDDDFEQRLFNAVLFSHNDIVVHDLYDINKPYREFVSIDKVVSIEIKNRKISRIAYTGCIEIDDEKVYGYIYIDSEKYEFYNKDLELELSNAHDYGMCPATFVVDDRFYPEGDERDYDGIVKLSIFSHVRDELETYTFLKVLQKITDTNGAFPVTVRPKTKEISTQGEDFDALQNEPMSSDQIGSQVSEEVRQTAGSGGGSLIQAGTDIVAPVVEKADGSIDMELLKNFITFYHAPVDILKFMDERINACANDIIISTIGAYSEKNDVSMTELQAKQGYVSKEDKLRWLSSTLSYSRKRSDDMMLSLAYGKNSAKCDIFYGSDFFLETPKELFEMFKNSPNSIERKNILIRLTQRRNMFNKEKQRREVILYKLIPYTSDKDFDIAVNQGKVDDITFALQTRFNYWIAMFESMYGNIETFWNMIDASESQKITEINILINNLISKQNGKETSS